MVKIQAQIILEILGRPPEHIKESLISIIERLSSEQGFKIIDKKIHDPKPVEDSQSLYTAFAEILLEMDSIVHYFSLLLAYMPAHIEIISPENLNFANYEFNEIGNRLLERLHDYDSVTKKMIYERDFLAQNLKESAPEVFKKITESANQDKNNQVKKSKTKKKTTKKTKKN